MSNLTKAEIEQEIANICQTMKGPLTNLERAFLHEDRKELRAMLAKINAEESRHAD